MKKKRIRHKIFMEKSWVHEYVNWALCYTILYIMSFDKYIMFGVCNSMKFHWNSNVHVQLFYDFGLSTTKSLRSILIFYTPVSTYEYVSNIWLISFYNQIITTYYIF